MVTKRSAYLLATAALFGCKHVEVDYDRRPCGPNQSCIEGYICNVALGRCEQVTPGCSIDADGDGEWDCVDTCIDVDGDGYGGGTSCTGADCDDTAATCIADCTTDADTDGTPDCRDGCLDFDRDGYGNAGGAGNTCIGADCADDASTCTVDCSDTGDGDGVPDCRDTCIDFDRDGYGNVGGGGNTCTGTDCSDSAPSCNVNCTTDLDNDSVVDCLDNCIDNDRDGYGVNGGLGACAGPDCLDSAPACSNNCGTNVDNDGLPDCNDPCIDRDGDGYGSAGGAGDTCTGPDCDDTVPACNTDCVTNRDADALPDCNDSCLDRDNDGFGSAGGLPNSCSGPDCNENNAACAANCATCPPTALVMIADTPVGVCTSSNIDIDLDGYLGAAANITCSAPALALAASNDADRIADFSTNDGWTPGTGVAIQAWQNGFPAGCPANGAGNFMRFDDNGTRDLDLTTPANASGYRNLSLRFLVGYDGDPEAGEHLTVYYCCGAGCTPATLLGTVANVNEAGGTNNCRTVTMNLPASADSCASLDFRFEYIETNNDNNDRAGIDDLQLSGSLIFAPVTDLGLGDYASSFTSCVTAIPNVTCTWNDGTNPPLSDAQSVTFQ